MLRSSARPRLEVADVVRAHGEEYRRRFNPSAAQQKVLRNVARCRTAALGGHKDTCDSCGHTRISYNSCRDRHCPKCQSLKKAEWLAQRCDRLLPVSYFHVVFTLPSRLNALVLGNKRILFKMLFDCAAETLQTIARDEKHLGADVGFTAILHTWGQNITFHPHLHCVVTGGGLSSDGQRWVGARERFFVSVEVLSRLFRGKFLAALRAAARDRQLQFAGSTADLLDRRVWRRFLNDLYTVDWVVYAKAPFGSPEHVFRYLGRYTHRVAISNHRLLELADGNVRFRAKDYADHGRLKTVTLEATEFIRRFLLHVLPRRFVRIRHYGLLAARNVNGKLARARRLLGDAQEHRSAEQSTSDANPDQWWQRLLLLTGIDVFACPRCKTGRMIRQELDLSDQSALTSPPLAEPLTVDTS